MAKLYFRYGTMDSSKTARLLMDAHEYEQRGEFALLLKSVLDTRSARGKIVSRIGLEADCTDVGKDENLLEMISNMPVKPSCIFVDESQFLTFEQVINLRMIVDLFGVPVMCYGLKTNFLGLLFDGSRALFEHANRYEEVKTICREDGCNHKAMYNGRFKDGKPVFNGEIVEVGDTEENSKDKSTYYYIPKCSEHFFKDYMKHQQNRGVL